MNISRKSFRKLNCLVTSSFLCIFGYKNQMKTRIKWFNIQNHFCNKNKNNKKQKLGWFVFYLFRSCHSNWILRIKHIILPVVVTFIFSIVLRFLAKNAIMSGLKLFSLCSYNRFDLNKTSEKQIFSFLLAQNLSAISILISFSLNT